MTAAGGANRTIAVFAPHRAHSIEVAAIMGVFAEANFWGPAGILYRTVIVAETMEPVRCASGLVVMPDLSIADEMPDVDTLIVIGTFEVDDLPHPVIDWIGRAAQGARRYGALSTGAFLLGEAGLLDGCRVTTHWYYANKLAKRFPRAVVDADPIFTVDGKLFTSAGVAASFDLALALVEADHGRDTALMLARRIVLYLKRPGTQSQFSRPLTVQMATQSPIARVQSWILENPSKDMSIEALAGRVAMSPRNFARVFRQETGQTPAEFVEEARVEAARLMLEDSMLSLDQIAMRSGFGTPASVRRTFLRRFGVTPSDYRDRFRAARSHAKN